jgi:hypothetical protein
MEFEAAMGQLVVVRWEQEEASKGPSSALLPLEEGEAERAKGRALLAPEGEGA